MFLLLMIKLLHGLINQNPRNYCSVVYMGSCRIRTTNSIVVLGCLPLGLEGPVVHFVSQPLPSSSLNLAMVQFHFQVYCTLLRNSLHLFVVQHKELSNVACLL